MTQELQSLYEITGDIKDINTVLVQRDRVEKAEKDVARLKHLMDYWLHSMARMLGVGFGNYKSNEDTRKKALEAIDSAMEASK